VTDAQLANIIIFGPLLVACLLVGLAGIVRCARAN
jgi:hypothetical protein